MKGVLATHAPESRIIDVSHGVEPFCVSQGAFFSCRGYGSFSPEIRFLSLLLIPEWEAGRRIIAAEFGKQVVLAPDNGVLELAEDRFSGTMIVTDLSEAAAKIHSSATFMAGIFLLPLPHPWLAEHLLNLSAQNFLCVKSYAADQ
ncbi:SAM-dependent chlorinase/fluorinase [Maridesulfovibrio sp.]|uniref:SAM-dependent chlorinase/fluorinase n=1 Tax=Maridesulfovibrio sp. TaxID=2795000 RepID=UPI0039EE3964